MERDSKRDDDILVSIWGSPDNDPEVRGWTLDEIREQKALAALRDAEKRKVAAALLDEIDSYFAPSDERHAEMKEIRQTLKAEGVYVRITKDADTGALHAEACDASGHALPDNRVSRSARDLINRLVFLDSASLRYNACLFELVRLGLAHEGALEGEIDTTPALRFVAESVQQ